VPVDAARKRHFAGDAFDAELVEQRDQPGVRAIVEDQEPGVDGKRPPLKRDVDRGGMAAKARFSLE